MEYIKIFWSTLLNELFPARCFKCGVTGTYICMSCVEELPRVAHDETGFVSVFQYKDETIRRLLWTLKYKGGKDIAAVCAKMLYEELCAELEELVLFQEFEKPLVIPIPLSQKRWRERGFNQAELIAKELVTHGEGFKLCVEVLEKHKETAPQATIKNREARLRNVLGCFSLSHPEQIAGRNIILIDDIYTTGGTMLEARKVLEAAGARKILCCTVAH